MTDGALVVENSSGVVLGEAAAKMSLTKLKTEGPSYITGGNAWVLVELQYGRNSGTRNGIGLLRL